jgi:hypothetical protein
MPRQCSVCRSARLAEFERLVARGMTVRDAADSLGLSYDSAKRHVRFVHVQRVPPVSVDLSAPGGAPGPDESPVEVFKAAFGMPPMPWQVEYATETRDTVVRKGRQVGATQAAAGLSIYTARRRAGADVVVISPSQRQSTEIVVRARLGFDNLGEKLAQDNAGLLRLRNGSRILSLPGNSRGIRGYAPALVIIDESAWVAPETFMAARPLVAASKGRLIVQSTPDASSEWFRELALNTPDGWARIVVRSTDVPTIDPAFLAREEREMKPDEYAQEYLAEFPDQSTSLGAIWTEDEWRALARPKRQE